MKKLKIFSTLGMLSAALFGCTGSTPEGKHITKAEYGEKWPFSVDEGNLKCEKVDQAPSMTAVIFEADGKIFACNGIAKGWAESKGWQRIDEIVLDDPSLPGAKMNYSSFIDEGLKQCK